MSKISALIIATALATAGLSQAAYAQSSASTQDQGALMGAGITGNPSHGSGDVNGPAAGNGGDMGPLPAPVPNNGSRLASGVTGNTSHGSGDVNGPASGNGDVNTGTSAGQSDETTPHVTQNPSHGSGEVNGPATGNGGDMGMTNPNGGQ